MNTIWLDSRWVWLKMEHYCHASMIWWTVMWSSHYHRAASTATVSVWCTKWWKWQKSISMIAHRSAQRENHSVSFIFHWIPVNSCFVNNFMILQQAKSCWHQRKSTRTQSSLCYIRIKSRRSRTSPAAAFPKIFHESYLNIWLCIWMQPKWIFRR